MLCSGRWSHPRCCWCTWSSVAVLRGARAAGVALCYGNNNRGACVAGSVHPLAPNTAPISPWLFSCPSMLSNKSLPPSLCSHSVHSLAPCISPSQTFPTSFSFALLFLCLFTSPPVSPLNFILSFAPQRRSFTPASWRRTKRSLEMQSAHRKCHCSRDFCLNIRSSQELLCVSRSLRGQCFPLPLRGRGWDGGVEGSGWPPAQLEKKREWRWRAEKGLTGHLYWCCEVQRRVKHAQSYLLEIHDSVSSVRSFSECLFGKWRKEKLSSALNFFWGRNNNAKIDSKFQNWINSFKREINKTKVFCCTELWSIFKLQDFTVSSATFNFHILALICCFFPLPSLLYAFSKHISQNWCLQWTKVEY